MGSQTDVSKVWAIPTADYTSSSSTYNPLTPKKPIFAPSLIVVDRLRAIGATPYDAATIAWEERERLVRARASYLSKKVDPIEGFPNAFPHQNSGARFLYGQRRVLCCDETGVGKTLQSIIAAWYTLAKGGVCLIYTLKGVALQWEITIKETFGAKVNVYNLARVSKNRAERTIDLIQNVQNDGSKSFIILNWDSLTQLSKDDKNNTEFSKLTFKCIIGDEPHLVKNRNAQRSIRFAQLVKSTEHLYLLTGTPVEKQASDMWFLLHMINHEKFTSFWAFHNAFVLESLDPTGVVVKTTKNVDVLHDILTPWYLKRTRAETIHTIEPVFYPFWVELSPEERKHYDQIEYASFRDLYTDDGKVQFLPTVLTKMSACRQAAISPILGSPLAPDKSAKLDGLEDLLSTFEDDERVVIYCSFRAGVEFAAQRLGADAQMFMGGSDPEIPIKFNKGLGPKYLICTPTSIGTGANLQIASKIVFIDLPWSGTTYRQAWGRIVRPGQRGSPIVYDLRARDTIDEYIKDCIIGPKNQMFAELVIARTLLEKLQLKYKRENYVHTLTR